MDLGRYTLLLKKINNEKTTPSCHNSDLRLYLIFNINKSSTTHNGSMSVYFSLLCFILVTIQQQSSSVVSLLYSI